MKIANKIALSTIALIIITIGIVTALSIYSIKSREKINLENFRQTEYKRVEQKLESLLDVTFESVTSTFENSTQKEYIQNVYGKRLNSVIDSTFSQIEQIYKSYQNGEVSESQAKSEAQNLVKAVRYDSGTGYIWINDTGKPYPKMIMHPIAYQLDGQILSAEKYNVAENNENLFSAMVKTVEKDKEGFVGYLWPKPGKDHPPAKVIVCQTF